MYEESGSISASRPQAFFAKHKHSFALIVVIGVLGESLSEAGIFEFGRQIQAISDHDNADLYARASADEKEARAQKIELNMTKTKLANAEAHLIEVRNENLPMDIGDQYSLAMALNSCAGINVELRTGLDANAVQTADWLASVFATSGWNIINRRFTPDIGEKGILIGYDYHKPDGIDQSSIAAAHLLLRNLLERNVPAKIIDEPFRVRGVPTNAIIVAVLRRPDKAWGDFMIAYSRGEEARLEETRILPRMMQLSSERFANSLELGRAQNEYNELSAQYSKAEHEKAEASQQLDEASDEISKENVDTNDSPGVRVYDSVGAIPGNTAFVASSNSVIRVHNASFNTPPLE